jgi:outer membrane murein-binding lipoprotein Lpp
MLRFKRVVLAGVVASVLVFASASPVMAESKNPRKHAVKCAQVAGKEQKIQAKITQLANRPASSDAEVQAARQAKLAKLQNRLPHAADGC